MLSCMDAATWACSSCGCCRAQPQTMEEGRSRVLMGAHVACGLTSLQGLQGKGCVCGLKGSPLGGNTSCYLMT